MGDIRAEIADLKRGHRQEIKALNGELSLANKKVAALEKFIDSLPSKVGDFIGTHYQKSTAPAKRRRRRRKKTAVKAN